MLEQVIPFLTASVILTLMPGPDVVYVLVQSIAYGKRTGIVISLGLVTGVLVHTSLVAFGVSALLKSSPTFFFFIKMIGAFYLFYLAYKAFKAKPEINLNQTNPIEQKSAWYYYRQGFFMNLLNPKVLLFFLSFFPGFLWKDTQLIKQFYLLGGIFIVQGLLIFSSIAVMASSLKKYILTHKNALQTIAYVQVFMFSLLGILILFS